MKKLNVFITILLWFLFSMTFLLYHIIYNDYGGGLFQFYLLTLSRFSIFELANTLFLLIIIISTIFLCFGDEISDFISKKFNKNKDNKNP